MEWRRLEGGRRLRKEVVTNRMRLQCAYCNKLPKEKRLVLLPWPRIRYPSKAKLVFCNIDHYRRWFNMQCLEENKKYIYQGDTEQYKGQKCTLVDLLEFKDYPISTSLVIVHFEGENGNWNCRANSLEVIK